MRVNEKDRSRLNVGSGITIVLAMMLLSSCRSSPVEPVGNGPTLMVNYRIETRSYVMLRVENNYNTTVATLVDTVENPGNYAVQWNYQGFPPGVYFYFLDVSPENGEPTITIVRKFVLFPDGGS